MRWLWKLFLVTTFLFILLIGILAVVDNGQTVSLKFLTWQTPELSLFWWMLMALLCGFVLGAMSMSFSTFKSKVKQRQLQRQLKSCERESKRLRDQSLVG